MPTLLDCAGLPIPETVEGRSLLPLARGEAADWRPYLHGEHTGFGQSLQWLTDGREKYVWFSGSGREQLFDLARDPQELHRSGPAGRATPGAWREWRARLIEELQRARGGLHRRAAADRPAGRCKPVLERPGYREGLG